MAEESRGAFLSTLGTGLGDLSTTYMGMKQMEYENIAELAKRDRLESFEIMKLQIGDQMSRQRIRLTGEQARETSLAGIRETARLRVGPATKVRVKIMDKHKINVKAEYDITIQDRTDVDTGERTWWKFDPTELPTPMWRQISDAEHKDLTAKAIGDPPPEGTPTGPGKTLDQRIKAYAADYNTTLADAWQAFYVAVTQNQQFPTITLDMLNELKAQYEEDETWDKKLNLPFTPVDEIDIAGQGLDKVEETWLGLASLAFGWGVKKGLAFLKWAKPWKRFGVGAVAGVAFDLVGRQLIDKNGVAVEDLPAFWDRDVEQYWADEMDGMSDYEQAKWAQLLLSLEGPGMELGQREALMRAINKRGLLRDGETVDQWVERASTQRVPELNEDVPPPTVDETAPVETAGAAPVTEGGTNCRAFAMSSEGRSAQKDWMDANGGTRKQAYDAIIAQCEEFNR